MVNNTFLYLKIKSAVLLSTIFKYIAKLTKFMAKIPENVNKNNANRSNNHKNLNHDISL